VSANPYFQGYADWLRWRAGRFTAGPPQLLQQYGIQLGDPNARFAALPVAFTEITGIPSLARWGQAIVQNRPIAEVEREYFERLAKELRVDPEEFKKRVGQAELFAALTALPLAVPLSKAEAIQLAKAVGAGFAGVGLPTAIIRGAQGYTDEALKAFIETGLAGSVLADAAMALREAAARLTPDRINAIRQQVRQRIEAAWRNPELDQFEREVAEALKALKEGDASKYDSLLKQFEEWQRKLDEVKKLYEAKQRGQLSPEDEARYYRLLQEVSKIKDKYEILKQYIDAARELGIEAAGRQKEFESRTISDLARAAQEAPPGPPPKPLHEKLMEMDLERLQQLVRNPQMLSRLARRFGVDEQILAEQVAGVLRSRQWERLSNLPTEELRKILMSDDLLKKYASELNMDVVKLRERLEELLQQRLGLAPPPEPPKPMPERPPIERLTERPPETQFRPPEGGTEVATKQGQVLIVRAREEPRPEVRRLEELPSVRERLRAVARLRERARERPRREEPQRAEEVQRERIDKPQKQHEDQPQRERADQPAGESAAEKTVDKTAERAAAEKVVEERGVLLLDRDALRVIVPALPAYVFALPAPLVLAMISREFGMPVALPPDVPRPGPREPFGRWLDRVFAGFGFTWRSLAAQKEMFVFA